MENNMEEAPISLHWDKNAKENGRMVRELNGLIDFIIQIYLNDIKVNGTET